MSSNETHIAVPTQTLTAAQQKHVAKYPHIIDVLIRERAKKLFKSPLWPLYRLFLNRLLGYQNALKMAEDINPLRGHDPFEYISDILKLQITITGLEHMPRHGACVLAINHPTGIADGMAIYDAIKNIRPDIQIYANRDAIRVCPGLDDIIIPVEWVQAKRTRARSRETLLRTKKCFQEGRPLVIFPSGKLAYKNEHKILTEREWMPTVAALPRKYNVPIIPIYMSAYNSPLYYLFEKIDGELRDITLFHEFLNKGSEPFTLMFAPPILPDELPKDNESATLLLKDYITQGIKDNIDWQTFKQNWKAPPAPQQP